MGRRAPCGGRPHLARRRAAAAPDLHEHAGDGEGWRGTRPAIGGGDAIPAGGDRREAGAGGSRAVGRRVGRRVRGERVRHGVRAAG